MEGSTLKQDVNEFISSREEVALENLDKDPEYQQITDESIEMRNKIAELLGENSDLIGDFNESMVFQSTFEIDVAYRQGFRDALALAREDSKQPL